MWAEVVVLGLLTLAMSSTTEVWANSAPDTPANLTLATGAKQINVSWSAPDDHGAPITHYTVQWKRGGLSVDPATLNGTPIGKWFFSDNAYWLWGWGRSEYAKVHDAAGQWKPIVGLPDRQVDGPVFDDLQEAQLWAEAILDRYWDWDSSEQAITSETTYAITGLADDTEYAVRVKADHDCDASAWTAPGWQVTASAPDTPAAPVLTLSERGLINVSAPAPHGGGLPITHYSVRVLKDDDSGTQIVMNGTVIPAAPSGDLSYTLEDLETGEYRIAIAASNAAGTSPLSQSSFAPFIRPPDAPGDVVAWPDDNGIHVDWESPVSSLGELRYDVRISLSDDSDVRQVWGLYDARYSTTSRLAIEGRNGTMYAIEVRAVARDYNNGNTRLNGFWSDKVFVTPGPPPLSPRFDDAIPGDGQVSLAWTPKPYGDPSDNANEITSYTLQWRSEQQDYHADRQVTTSDTLYTITGLTNMTEYDVRVKATNAAGDSDWSERYARTAWPPAAPAQPHVTRGGPRELVVSWSEPPDNGAAITSYTVWWHRAVSLDGTPSDGWSVRSSGPGFVYAHFNTGSYAQIESAEGWQEDATSATAWIPHVAFWQDPPRYFKGPIFDDLQEAQLWAEYVMEFDPVYEATTSDTTYTITGLPHDVPHDVWVKATNAAGDSYWSPEIPPQSGVAHPSGAPTAVLTPGAGQIQVSWSEPPDNGAAITSYTVWWQGVVPDRAPSSVWEVVADPVWGDMYRYTPDDKWPQAAVVEKWWDGGWVATVWQSKYDSRNSPVTSLEEALLWAEAVMDNPDFDDTVYRATTSNTTYTISGLFNDTRYEVKVKATNAAGDSEWSSMVSAKTARPPGAPTVVLTPGVGQIQVSWPEPPDNGAPITEYVVQWTEEGDILTKTATTTTTSYTITGLPRVTTYEVEVKATNGAGDSEWSSTQSARTPGVPGAPHIYTAFYAITLLRPCWNSPNNGGASITHFILQWRLKSASDWSNPSQTTTTSDGCQAIEGLLSETTYLMRVRAVNGVGSGPWSNTYELATARPRNN